MIFQGLFNIVDIYFNQIDLYFNSVEAYFLDALNKKFGLKLTEKYEYSVLIKELKELLEFIKVELTKEIGLDREYIETIFSDQLLDLNEREMGKNVSIKNIYNAKIAPIIFEIFLKKVFEYLVDEPNASTMMLTFKSKGFLPIEFIMEIRNLKMLFERSPEKTKNLRKYMQIKNKIVHKLYYENKANIEALENFEDPRDKLQLFYMVYKIIDFFGIKNLYNFSRIKEYIKDNIEEWLDTIPLVTLKNPDLYYCGIYLAKHLPVLLEEEEEDIIKYFLTNIYDESIDEFEAPIIEATNKVYYFFEASWLIDLELSEEQIKELLKGERQFFESNYIKNLETSQLVLILKIYNILGIYNKIDAQKIKNIVDEIDQRVTPDGIKQFRDGFISSEATYHVLFSNYFRNTLKSLKDSDYILDKIVSRIYRNLEILDFTQDTNYDLISELFYSCESLKLLNCIETKQLILYLAKYLFPQNVTDKVINSDEVASPTSRFRHLKVSRITGEIID